MSCSREREINTLIIALREYWHNHPQLRLGQLVSNLAGKDPFHVQDRDLLEQLVSYKDNTCIHPGCFIGEVCPHCGKKAI